MSDSDTLRQLFPVDGAIPGVHRLDALVRQPDGGVAQVEIGRYPVVGEAESDARKATDNSHRSTCLNTDFIL